MRNRTDRLSRRGEFLIVVGGAFLLPTLISVFAVFDAYPTVLFSNASLQGLLFYEVAVSASLLLFLHLRGWNLKGLGLRPDATGTLLGFAFACGVWIAWLLVAGAVETFLSLVGGLRGPDFFIVPGLTLPIILAVSIVNALFEEVFVCSYVVSALRNDASPWPAIQISAAIRLLYHFYQGAPNVLGLLPLSLFFAWWYARTGRLWPLVVAHTLLDFVAFAPFAA